MLQRLETAAGKLFAFPAVVSRQQASWLATGPGALVAVVDVGSQFVGRIRRVASAGSMDDPGSSILFLGRHQFFSKFFGPARGGIDGRFRVEFGFTDLKKIGRVGVDRPTTQGSPSRRPSTSENDTSYRREKASLPKAIVTVLKISFIVTVRSRNRETVQ
jgi:hypothetical protein